MSLIKRMVTGSGIGAIAILQGIAATPSLAQPEPVTGTTFFCGAIADIPATIARTPNGEMPIVIWDATRLPDTGVDLQQQCEEVSQRFQTYHDNGSLNYITSGMMDGELVACVADAEGEACTGMLFPLKPDINPRGSLQQIFRIRVASVGPIGETGDRLYINLDKYLNGEYPGLPPLGTRIRQTPPQETPEVLPNEENL